MENDKERTETGYRAKPLDQRETGELPTLIKLTPKATGVHWCRSSPKPSIDKVRIEGRQQIRQRAVP